MLSYLFYIVFLYFRYLFWFVFVTFNGVELHSQQKQYVHNSKPVVWILSEAAMELQNLHKPCIHKLTSAFRRVVHESSQENSEVVKVTAAATGEKEP